MKKNYKGLLMIVSIFSLIFLNAIPAQAAELQSPRNTIQTNGKATLKVKPNIAYINLSVRTENKDAKKAQSENAKVVEKVKSDLISKYVLSDTDVRTSYYNVYPTYDYVEGKQVFRGYVVEHGLEVTARNIEQVGDIIDTAIASGATSVSNIRFDIVDSDATYNLALKRAVENATSKAQALAETIGKTNIKPISIVEQSGSIGIIDRGMAKLEMAADSASVATQIQQGEIEVTAQVIVTFQW